MLQAPHHLEWALPALKPGAGSWSRCILMDAWWRGIVTPLAMPAPALLLQPVCHLSCKGRLLAHGQLFPHQSPNILFCKAVFFSAPAFSAAQGYCIPGTGFVLAVVDFTRSLWAHSSRSLSNHSPALHCCHPCTTFAEDTKVAEALFPLSLVKMLNSVGPGIDPQGTLLVTNHCWTLHCWSQPFQHSSL